MESLTKKIFRAVNELGKVVLTLFFVIVVLSLIVGGVLLIFEGIMKGIGKPIFIGIGFELLSLLLIWLLKKS